MAVFKCKMCGGTLEINTATVATCEYCGTKQTLPKINDEKRAQLYDRANHLRRNNEFDKACGMYEQLLDEGTDDAEAYWSLVLCRYGIEYVEDPSSHKRIPTVNRAQFTSIFDDDNYKSALKYADTLQRMVYEDEAKTINEIQKGILAISQKEDPFDVFICYKETDDIGRRTPDSVLANDLYHQLTQEGFKVFFARITLEDKLGSAYEPYIFAALNSSKVMIVLGTKPEYFNAPWVKNEWSRYLSLIKSGKEKMLIPAYKDMDPYDLPEEFSHLQAQDMSKLGFMQDLIRGIKKILLPDIQTTKDHVMVGAAATTDTAPLLERVFMFLEDKEWASADEYCEKILDVDPKCAMAYLGKLMSELRASKKEELKNAINPFMDRSNCQKVMRFGDEALKKELEEYNQFIVIRNENARQEKVYSGAVNLMNFAKGEFIYKEAAAAFESIPQYKDSSELAAKCRELAEIARKDSILAKGKQKMAGGVVPIYEESVKFFDSIPMKNSILGKGKQKMLDGMILNHQEAIELFKTIPGWKDADESILECEKQISEIKRRQESERIELENLTETRRENWAQNVKKTKIIAILVLASLFLLTIIITVIFFATQSNVINNDVIALTEARAFSRNGEKAILSTYEQYGTVSAEWDNHSQLMN